MKLVIKYSFYSSYKWYVPVTYVRSNGDVQYNFTHPETTWLKDDGLPGKRNF